LTVAKAKGLEFAKMQKKSSKNGEKWRFWAKNWSKSAFFVV